jgi:hypothetical protein
MSTFRAQFVGRFAYLFSSDGRTLMIVAPKMEAFKPHLASLAIPARFIEAGDSHAQRTISIPGDQAASWVVWDLQGVDVEFFDYVGGGVVNALPDPAAGTPGVANLLALAPRAGLRPELGARHVDANLMTTRITIGGGTIGPVDTASLVDDDDPRYAFKSFDDRTIVGAKEQTVSLVDATQWLGHTAPPTRALPLAVRGLTIRLRSFCGENDRTISCKPNDQLMLGFAHTCNCSSLTDRDEEFAAYYTLLNPVPAMSERQIPVVKPAHANAFIFGSSPDCQGIVKAQMM